MVGLNAFTIKLIRSTANECKLVLTATTHTQGKKSCISADGKSTYQSEAQQQLEKNFHFYFHKCVI